MDAVSIAVVREGPGKMTRLPAEGDGENTLGRTTRLSKDTGPGEHL